jgi:hypothetical protein
MQLLWVAQGFRNGVRTPCKCVPHLAALRSGVPLPYVAAMLCTLGAYSVYSFLVTGRSISWKTAASVYAGVCATGIIAAIVTATVLHV